MANRFAKRPSIFALAPTERAAAHEAIRTGTDPNLGLFGRKKKPAPPPPPKRRAEAPAPRPRPASPAPPRSRPDRPTGSGGTDTLSPPNPRPRPSPAPAANTPATRNPPNIRGTDPDQFQRVLGARPTPGSPAAAPPAARRPANPPPNVRGTPANQFQETLGSPASTTRSLTPAVPGDRTPASRPRAGTPPVTRAAGWPPKPTTPPAGAGVPGLTSRRTATPTVRSDLTPAQLGKVRELERLDQALTGMQRGSKDYLDTMKRIRELRGR